MRNNAGTTRIGGTILTLVVAAGCSIFSVDNKDHQLSLDDSRSRWEASGVTDYTMRFQRLSSCFICQPTDLIEVRITVRGDTIREVFDIAQNLPFTDFTPGVFLTIDELFDFIQEAIDLDAAEIDISYDRILGYPIDITVDISRRFFDDETSFQVREFTELD